MRSTTLTADKTAVARSSSATAIVGKMRREASAYAVLAALLCSASPATAALGPANCGPLSNAYGPFDYRTTRGNQLFLVESAHFTTSVEMLIRGERGAIGQDLDYTLRAFPNHHRALLSMMRYGERLKLPKVPRANYEVECYFVRAVTFQPDDIIARMLFSKFLVNAGRQDEALQQLKLAQEYAGDNPFSHYNLGLSFLEAGDYKLALEHAHKAMALGFPRTELQDQLKAKGSWRDPVGTPADQPASAASGGIGTSAPAAASAASAP